MELQLKIIGGALIVLGIIHIIFPKYFKWQDELKHLSLINRQMMQTHTFFIALTVSFMGVLCLTQSEGIINTPLGQNVAFGLGVFWSLRLFFQLFVYSSKLWKGKLFETAVHILFTLFWIYMTVVFFMIYF